MLANQMFTVLLRGNTRYFRRRIDILNFQNILEEEADARKSYVYFLNYFHSNQMFTVLLRGNTRYFRRRIDILNFQNILEEEADAGKSYVYFLNYFHSNRIILITCINIY